MSCSDNDASRIISFLNARVQALWTKAIDYTTERWARYSQHQDFRHAIAPAKYSLENHNGHLFGPAEKKGFDIHLKAPTIDFICNHTAVLELNVTKAQFAFDRPKHSHLALFANRTNEEISDIKVTFRMSFQATDVMVDEKDKGTRPAKRFDLSYRHAKLVQISPSISRGREAFEAYLQGYLSFLQTAGHATFFCPTSFYGENQPISLNFSRAPHTSPTGTGAQTMPMEEINRFLCTSWLMASTMPRSQPGKPVDCVALSLAESRSKVMLSGKDVHFRLIFGPPEVEVAAVCDDEAILYFDIAEALFYKTSDYESHPFKVFCDWKVAVLTNIKREQMSDSNVIKYVVDPRGSHFVPHLSQLAGCLEADQEAAQCRDRIIEFISGEYLNVLEKAGYLVILHHDPRRAKSKHYPSDISDPATTSPSENDREAPITKATTSSSSAGPVIGPTTWQDLSQRVDMAGFDQVFALSETSINDRFQSQWAQSQSDAAADRSLTEWHHDDHFSATFGPLELQLTSERKAILRVKLVKGSLKPVRGRSFRRRNVDRFHFSDWLVAFSINLKLCDHASLPGVEPGWRSDFARSHPLSSRRDVTFNHVYLDLQHAEFDLEHSSFKDLCTADDKRSIDKAQAAVVYLRDHYFKRLASTGHHILSTVPVWDASSHAFSRRLTSVTFYTDSERARFDAGVSQAHAREPAVLVVGMYDGKPLPRPIPQRWGAWVSNSPSSSHGTLALSADSFLHASLLPILSEMNAMTRIEPTPSVVERSPWQLYLTCWSNHSQRVVGDCAFVPDGADGPLRYHWRSGRKFNIGRDESRFGLSRTENYLELPTTPSSDGLDIALYGTVCLELVETGWRSVAYAHWRTVVKVSFEDCQPRTTTVTYPTEFTETESEGRPSSLRSFNPQEMLRNAFPETIEVRGLEQGLRPLVTVLQACRTGHPGCHFVDPVFNRKGDLLFRISAQPSSPAPTSDDLAVLPEPHGLNTHLRLKPSSPIPARDTFLEGIPAHMRMSTAGVYNYNGSPGGSPIFDVFSPTRDGAKHDSFYTGNLEIDDQSELSSPATSFSSTSASTKPDLSPPCSSIFISPLNDSSVSDGSSQTLRSSPMEVTLSEVSLSEASSSEAPPTEALPAELFVPKPRQPPQQDIRPSADPPVFLAIPASPVNDLGRDGSTSSGGSVVSRTQPLEQGADSARPALSLPPRLETQFRPSSSASVGCTLFNTGKKDTQTVPTTPAVTNNQATSSHPSTNMTRGNSSAMYLVDATNVLHRLTGGVIRSGTDTTAASNGGAPPAHHVYPAPPQLSTPDTQSPNVTLASHANAANVRAPLAAAAHTNGPAIRGQETDSSLAYPHFLPRDNSSFGSDKTLQPAPDVVLDPTTPAGRKALREKFKAAATPQVPKDKYDAMAAGSMGIGFASSAADLAPKSDPSSRPTRPLTHVEAQNQLAAVAVTINNPWLRC
ncbi:uncharacterized protein PHACADRAFT_29322 [Phanerochaete carnosa HHB-10118-sp]|uniref:Uncharacterized protein n=1 Tax=Phanerochaete carnosa (strain HHB-10118-sp) TaxID=650164 RepID=K5W4G5_PHACS|nr:uncharacterized protein PHACADRAFT_29322 [Phanerochaete carnosa HHB-10118-sp]EKM54055.1 hypothetical protein PHACADRAFT_29322 [Phanerochaete carnosa HHB-10118-sp]